MDLVLAFSAGVLVTLLVVSKQARRTLLLVCAIGALFGGVAIYASATPSAPSAPSAPAPAPSAPAVPGPPIGDL